MYLIIYESYLPGRHFDAVSDKVSKSKEVYDINIQTYAYSFHAFNKEISTFASFVWFLGCNY